jgi:uncharacterized protein YbjQ (UPF0145 family)
MTGRSTDVLVSGGDLGTPYDIVGTISFWYTSTHGVVSDSLTSLIQAFRETHADRLRRRQGGSHAALAFEAGAAFDRMFLLTVDELRVRAAALGADAVIGMRHDVDATASDRDCLYVEVSGVAVRRRALP